MKEKVKEILVVLDYSDSSVNIYNDIPDIDDAEVLLRHYGHKSSQCSWMFSTNLSLTINNDYNEK